MGKRILNRQLAIDIPEEIIEEILFKLPVQTLLRVKCVSKSWRSIISSKAFIKEHLKRSEENTGFTDCNKLLFSFDDNLSNYASCSLRDEPIITPHLNSYTCDIAIIGSCNGLILVETINSLQLWNPSTRKVVKEFKPPSSFDDENTNSSGYGLGYDASTDDYKVVCVESGNYPGRIYTKTIHMYSCNTDSWKKIETSEKACPGTSPAKFVNGRFHWSGKGGIVSLHLSGEKLRKEIAYPAAQRIKSNLEDLGGYLSLVCIVLEGSKIDTHVWAMMEYGVTESWTKIWTLSDFVDSLLGFSPRQNHIIQPLCLKKNGDIAVVFGSGEIVVYNGKRELRKSRVHIPYSEALFESFVVYVESLVS